MSRTVASRWRSVLVAGALLFVGSALPLPTRVNPDFGPYGPDKALHLLGHAGFAAALVAAAEDDDSAPVGLAAVVLSTSYGVSTELLQERVPGREFETGDVLAGLLGSVLGVVGWRRLARP